MPSTRCRNAWKQEPNDQPANAQPVTLPIIVNGRIDRPGDWDVFRFEGRAGQQIVAEVDARRLDSPLDSVLKLTDADGKQLAFNDDYEDKGDRVEHAPRRFLLTATLPADGTYYLHLGDAQHKGGAEYAYRLRISAPRPDFALRVVPSSINVRAGASGSDHRLRPAKRRVCRRNRLGVERRSGRYSRSAAPACRPTRTRCG